MQSQTFQFLALSLIMALIPACKPSNAPSLTGESNEAGEETSPAADLPAAIELVRFDLGRGRTAKITHFPEVGGVLYEELGPEHTVPVFATRPGLGVLEIFLELSPVGSPIPRALVEADGPGAAERVAGRPQVDTLPGTITVGDARSPQVILVAEETQTGPWDCDQGAAAFEASFCSGSVPSNAIEYCDSGQWHNLVRSSGDSRRERSLGIFVACGTQVQIRHYYRDAFNWHKLAESWIPSGYWMSSLYDGIAKWRRRVNYDRVYQLPGSYLRAYTVFYNG
jgi:hypothetical protein